MREIYLRNALLQNTFRLLIAAGVLSYTGPFGTYDAFPVFGRLAFWITAIVTAGAFIHVPVYLLLNKYNRSRKSAIFALIAGVLLGAIPATAAVIAVFAYFISKPFSWTTYPVMWGNVVVIGLVIAAIQFWQRIAKVPVAETPDHAQPLEEEQQTSRGQPSFPLLAKMSQTAKPTDIISFSMRDHYVEITTRQGVEMLLMRFQDALDLLGDLDGCRLHRSHWAAASHIVDLRRSGRAHEVILSDGRTLPVSATYLDCAKTMLKEKSAA